VIDVTGGGPAVRAGLHGSDRRADLDGEQVEVGGDVIVAIDNHLVSDFDDLVSYLVGRTRVGDEVTLTLLRDGTEQAIEVTLASRPAVQESLIETLP
jgi:serine protease Do